MVVKDNVLFEEIDPEVLRVEGAIYPQMVQKEKKNFFVPFLQFFWSLRLFQNHKYTHKKGEMAQFFK